MRTERPRSIILRRPADDLAGLEIGISDRSAGKLNNVDGLNVSLANSWSCRRWRLIQPTTMLLPAIGLEIYAPRCRRFDRRLTLKTAVTSMLIEIIFERD